MKCALNSQSNSATGESPHYIIFGEDKLLPYELLTSNPKPIYNFDNVVATRTHKFQEIHEKVKQHMKTYSEEVKQQQHKHAKLITLKVGNLVMARIHVPLGNSNKLSPKYTGPYRIMKHNYETSCMGAESRKGLIRICASVSPACRKRRLKGTERGD